jgi:hypothetical protein
MSRKHPKGSGSWLEVGLIISTIILLITQTIQIVIEILKK